MTYAPETLWRFRSIRSGYERTVRLHLHPELHLSPCVGDVDDASGEEQLDHYVRYLANDGYEALDAIPIYWSVASLDGGIGEHAPFAADRFHGTRYRLEEDFLTWLTWPVNAATGERLDWFQLPVIDDRFPEFAKALGWVPSPLQPTAPLASILRSRSGAEPVRTASRP